MQPPILSRRSTEPNVGRIDPEWLADEDDGLRRHARVGARGDQTFQVVERRRAGSARLQRGRRRPSASAVLQVAPVCACSAMASTASGVSKPGKPATSKPPSGCCWVVEPARPRSRWRRSTPDRPRPWATTGDDEQDGDGERAECTRARDGCASWVEPPPAPVHEGLLSTAARAAPLREHRWSGGQWRVAWLTDSGRSRSAAHSCGSASVSHRLPPSRRRQLPSSGTARNIRVARDRCRAEHPRGRDERRANSGDARPAAPSAVASRPSRRGTPWPGSCGRSRPPPACSWRRARSTSRS